MKIEFEERERLALVQNLTRLLSAPPAPLISRRVLPLLLLLDSLSRFFVEFVFPVRMEKARKSSVQ